MRPAKPLPTGIHVRSGRRWPQVQHQPQIIDDRLLGRDWDWEFDENEDRTLVRRYDLLHVA